MSVVTPVRSRARRGGAAAAGQASWRLRMEGIEGTAKWVKSPAGGIGERTYRVLCSLDDDGGIHHYTSRPKKLCTLDAGPRPGSGRRTDPERRG
jgi:hypothetical protein